MYYITKDFDFCYGHRVWTQKLDAELSVNQPCKCRHLHGHQGKITIKLETEILENNMVTDFHHLNWFKGWVDSHFDHKMILDSRDPLLSTLLKGIWGKLDDPVYWIEDSIPTNEHGAIFYTPNLATLSKENLDTATKEFLEGICIVNFVPTSESLSRFFYTRIQAVITKNREAFGKHVQISSVVFQETPKTSASYAA